MPKFGGPDQSCMHEGYIIKYLSWYHQFIISLTFSYRFFAFSNLTIISQLDFLKMCRHWENKVMKDQLIKRLIEQPIRNIMYLTHHTINGLRVHMTVYANTLETGTFLHRTSNGWEFPRP